MTINIRIDFLETGFIAMVNAKKHNAFNFFIGLFFIFCNEISDERFCSFKV
jgi:hypothetical protein